MRHVLPLGLALLMFAGCSISKSISSPFEWSSDSIASSSGSSGSSRSSSRDRAQEYRNDVRDYTAAYVQSGGQFDTFNRGLGSIASKHGVSNWEADDNTYVGIGEGLRKAGVTSTQLSVWKSNLSAGDSSRAAAIQEGYESYAP
jgi:hypothetical protein